MSDRPTEAPDLLTLLRGVSRSFYLSIRVLPPALRQPIAVAYLLARATDTIADTAEMAAPRRLALLETLARAIDGRALRADVESIVDTFAPLQHDEDERRLIQALPVCLAWLEHLHPEDVTDIRTVLEHITRGQSLDVARFGDTTAIVALQSADQLDEYTWLVAGCVGEFWTSLCFRHLPGFARLPEDRMRDLGAAYGMGLQLVNILRDTGSDLRQGRCYFPADELAAAGMGPHEIMSGHGGFDAIRARWLAKAQRGLQQGIVYATAVSSRRVRAGTALPALIGARTIALLEASGADAVRNRVKVPRREVWAIAARLAITLAGRDAMNAQFARLSGKPAPGGWENPAQ